jgi:glutathione peroxidase
MKTTTTLAIAVGITGTLLLSANRLARADRFQQAGDQICGKTSSFVIRRLDSQEREDFCAVYNGKVVLVVNTASRCGYTYQYEDLRKLYSLYRNRGFVVVGFPSNDFGNQEPEKENSIKKFCRLTYGVDFPMYAKTRVIGADANPLYRSLNNVAGQSPRWNFHKYLLDREGRLVGSYASAVEPLSCTLTEAIERLL